jgi:hypothetical protein
MKPSPDPGARGSETHYRADAPTPGRGASAGEDSAAQALLELVLQQTMAAYAKTQAAPESVREALREVARRYRGESLSFEPCLVALVSAVIREPFAAWAPAGEAWDALCRRVAQTMYDDPTARARLESLWAQLQEPGP